jgi:succinate dehydrogenase/fumarate reductase flavoprotein subunit
MSEQSARSGNVDVVVVSAGLAGVAAALTGAEADATVCLLEKGADFGGSSVRAGGGLLFAGTGSCRPPSVVATTASSCGRRSLSTATGRAIPPNYCGLKVDGQLRVLDVFGEVIPNLYTAGEVVGGFHGATYLSGTGLGKAGVFGRAARLESSGL